MSPRTATFLTALGLLAAGAPLPFLMHPHEHGGNHHHHDCCGHEHHEHAENDHADTYRVPATLRSSDAFISLELRLGEQLLYRTNNAGPLTEFTLALPAAEAYDIEVRAEWADEASHALSLTLDVPRRETRSVTHWGEKTLHTLFRFSW